MIIKKLAILFFFTFFFTPFALADALSIGIVTGDNIVRLSSYRGKDLTMVRHACFNDIHQKIHKVEKEEYKKGVLGYCVDHAYLSMGQLLETHDGVVIMDIQHEVVSTGKRESKSKVLGVFAVAHKGGSRVIYLVEFPGTDAGLNACYQKVDSILESHLKLGGMRGMCGFSGDGLTILDK